MVEIKLENMLTAEDKSDKFLLVTADDSFSDDHIEFAMVLGEKRAEFLARKEDVMGFFKALRDMCE